MSKEQIEEMRKDLIEIFDEEYEKRRLITADFTAIKMTDKGYSKQSEGEWISNRQTDEFICSLCGAIAPVDCLKEAFYESKFCPNCGARMKGGAE